MKRRRIAQVCLAAVVAVAPACAEDRFPEGDPDVFEAQDRDRSVFFDDPAAMEGETLTLEVEVESVLDPRVFTIVADDPSGDHYLVIHDGGQEVSAGERVEVTAVVEEVDVPELEDEIGSQIDIPTFEIYEGDYALYADEVSRTR